MKKAALLLFGLLVSYNFYPQKESKGALPESFYGCWSASFEEDPEQSKTKTYRSCDYSFPPKRFRPTVKFDKEGKGEFLKVGPTDAHTMEECTWTYDKKKKRVVVKDKEGKTQMKFIITSLGDKIMKVKPEKF